jgi:hypothetical protein
MKVFSELRMWFLVMLAVGSFGILAGWAFDSTWLTVAAPVGAMFFYFLPARFRDRSLFDTYVFADSFYFLGFLFTLISLLVSLLGFAEGGVGADEITGSVTRFGVALLTTVIGLAVRVFLVNFRPEIDDSMAQAESALAQSSLELRNHLDQLNADLVVQTDSWTTSLSHAVSRANAELEAAYSSGAQVVRASAEHFAESTEKEAQAVSGAVAGLATGIRTSSSTLGEATDQLKRQIASFEMPDDSLARVVDPALQQLAASLDQCRVAIEAVRIDPSAAMDALGNLADQARRSSTEAAELASRLESIDGEGLAFNARQFAAALGDVNEALRIQQAGLSEIETELARDAGLVKSYRRHLEQQVAESRHALGAVSEAMVGAAKYVAESLRDERQ